MDSVLAGFAQWFGLDVVLVLFVTDIGVVQIRIVDLR